MALEVDRTLTARSIAQAYDVPPWIIEPAYPKPRLAWLRWALRRVWTLPY